MKTWLDTETKSILRKSPPNKLAPPNTKAFTLVLLSINQHHTDRLVRAIQRISLDSKEQATAQLNQNMPMVLKQGLTESDALLGQFELICCDAISVFVPDDVVKFGTSEYLTELYNNLLHSDEFTGTNVVVNSIPNSESGAEFVDQFLTSFDKLPTTVTVPFKKARIMIHWGAKIGVELQLADGRKGGLG